MSPDTIPKILFQESKPSEMATALRATWSPASTITMSLTNFPTRKDGMKCKGLMRAMPAAVNKGVEGNGTRV